ncbi:MAG TPA: F0F1 ATP synthase subunit gamma [Actinomycetota bacterium]|nr:F0F1 ATP synthase subunit gamma [Actinomycetota bacterium]
MGAKLREVRRRIRSVQSTMKITRAMELIATSRIMKAQERVEQSRPYANRLTAAITDVASVSAVPGIELLEERPEPKASAVFVVTSDRGLAGGYNANVLRVAEELFAKVRSEGKEPKLFVSGRKGVSYYRFRGRRIEESWTGFSETPNYDHAVEIADALIEKFVNEEVDEIHGVYTDFESPMRQRPAAVRFVPMVFEEVERPVEEEGPQNQYIFEPEPAALLEALLPRYIRTRVFNALLESAASEHAARRRAMAAATENADELIKVLTREANQARQTEITTEIMEIVGGAEALRKQAGGQGGTPSGARQEEPEPATPVG